MSKTTLACLGIDRPLRPDLPSLVFIHGAGGTGRFWSRQIDGLAGLANLLALDLPGHGRSPGPARDRIEDYAADLVGFLDVVEPPRPVPVGVSMGGAVALQVLADHPGRFAGAVLVATGAKLKVGPEIFEAIERDFDQYVELVGATAAAPKSDPALFSHALADMTACGPEVVSGDFRACDAFDLRDRIPGIRVPALVIFGDQDVLTPPRYSDWLVEHIPDASRVEITGAGHFAALEKSDSVNRAIADFLARL